MPTSLTLASAGLLLLATAVPLRAQKPVARIFGTIIDSHTQAPVPDADIIHMGDGRVVKSDDRGLYSFDQLQPGLVKFMVRAARFPVTTFVVALTPGEQFERDVDLDSIAPHSNGAQTLPEVKVKAEPSLGPRYADFERRRRVGIGQFLVRAQIEKANFALLEDAMRGMLGVNLECGGGTGCSIRMARAPARCAPDYVVDERVDNFFGPRTAIRDIEAIEVYTGPSELPGEFAGSKSGCGLVVIWTRAGPPRPAKSATKLP